MHKYFELLLSSLLVKQLEVTLITENQTLRENEGPLHVVVSVNMIVDFEFNVTIQFQNGTAFGKINPSLPTYIF